MTPLVRSRGVRRPPRVRRGPAMRGGRVWAGVAAAVAVGALVAVLGFGPAHTALAAAAALALGSITGGVGEDPGFAELPAADRAGFRRDVSELSWMLTSASGRVGAGFHRRLRLVARDRLAVHGLDLDAPSDTEQLRAVLGDTALAVLRAPHNDLPGERDVARCLDALDALGPTPDRRTL